MQAGEKRSAARTTCHGATGCGGFQRSSPTGGAANGIPRYSRTPHPHPGVPETRPPSTLIGSWIAPKRGNTRMTVKPNKLVRIVLLQMAIEKIRKRDGAPAEPSNTTYFLF